MRTPSLLLLGLFTLPACAPPSEETERESTPHSQASPPPGKTENAEIRFTGARIFVPSGSDRKSPEYLLAPIIVHETLNGSRTGHPGWQGDEKKNPLVYLARSVVEIHGVAHPQLIYSWRYGDSAKTAETANGTVRILRMTLDSSGYPAIYEILAGNGELATVHVSRGLEQESSQEHGKPLPGRKYSVESGPGIKVAGLVEDGPLALGPLVFVSLDGKRVVTLSCRCSPSRIDKVDESLNYDLLPITKADGGENGIPDILPPTDQTLGALRIPRKF